MSDMLSREDIVLITQAEGLDVTERALRFWALDGLIPRPVRVDGCGPKAFYDPRILPWIRLVAALRPANIEELREELRRRCTEANGDLKTLLLGGETLEISPPLHRWGDDGTEFSLHLLLDSSQELLLRKRQRKEKHHGLERISGEAVG